jgi:hypothetical protein
VEFDFNEPEKPKPAKVKEKSLTDSEISILALVEQIYWETGHIPTQETIVSRLDSLGSPKVVKRVRDTFNNQKFQEALEIRGLERPMDAKRLTATQLLLVNMLLNVEDKKSLRQKLDLLNINMAKYQTWLRDPAFHEYLTMRTEQMFENSDHDAYKALLQSVVRGDVSALKLFFEMRGIYSPRIDVNINIESVIYRVVEVVGKHIKDPQILNAIADEVEQMEIPRYASK